MNIKKLSYNQKRKIMLACIAIVLLLITILACATLIYLLYGEALFSSPKVQLKKAENYAAIVNDTPKEGIVFVGDSIIELYDLKKHYKDPLYINRGISSNKSADVLNRLQTNVIDLNPKIIVLHVGTNDIGHKIPYNDYISNMDKIIKELKGKLPNCKIIVDSIFPTVTLDNYNSKNLTKVRDNYTILNFNQGLINLCITNNVTYLDIHHHLLKGEKLNKTYTIDGLHLSESGYNVVTREISYCISNLLENDKKAPIN